MNSLYRHPSTRHAFAARLRQQLATLPWPENQPHTDQSSVHRPSRETEDSLADELTRWPHCRLVRTASGTYVCLLLDNLSVFSRTGIVGACWAWLAEAEETEGRAQGPQHFRRPRNSRDNCHKRLCCLGEDGRVPPPE
jgi:hypothetical protein